MLCTVSCGSSADGALGPGDHEQHRRRGCHLSLDARGAVTFPALAPTWSSSTVISRRSPGVTCRRKRALSIPPKSGRQPLKRVSASNAMPPSWAIASTMSTPGRVGRPGKCPLKNGSAPVNLHTPLALRPGSTEVTSSTKRNGGRWGRTSSGLGSLDRPSDPLAEPLNGPSPRPRLPG